MRECFKESKVVKWTQEESVLVRYGIGWLKFKGDYNSKVKTQKSL